MKKCGSYPINDFDGWPSLEGKDSNERDLVYFAVKKDHDMNYRYEYLSKPLTFEGKVNDAILNNIQEFDYRNHHYKVKNNEDGNYDIVSNERKIAEAMVDGLECIIEIDEESRKYVRNTISKYYDEKYKKLFSKIRRKEYGVSSQNEGQKEVVR